MVRRGDPHEQRPRPRAERFQARPESDCALAQTFRRAKPAPSAFRSAMSMLTFYQNRAGRTLSKTRKRTLEEAKEELRRIFGRS